MCKINLHTSTLAVAAVLHLLSKDISHQMTTIRCHTNCLYSDSKNMALHVFRSRKMSSSELPSTWLCYRPISIERGPVTTLDRYTAPFSVQKLALHGGLFIRSTCLESRVFPGWVLLSFLMHLDLFLIAESRVTKVATSLPYIVILVNSTSFYSFGGLFLT